MHKHFERHRAVRQHKWRRQRAEVAELAAAGIAAASTVHPGAGPTSIPSLPSMPDSTVLKHPKLPRDPRGAGLKTVRSNVELGSAATRPSLLLHNPLQQRHHHQRSATPPCVPPAPRRLAS